VEEDDEEEEEEEEEDEEECPVRNGLIFSFNSTVRNSSATKKEAFVKEARKKRTGRERKRKK
jgi:hypothetical protein